MPFYVITKTYLVDPSKTEDVLNMSKASAEIFKKQPGLIEIHSLLAENETHISTFLIWENQQSHLDCMESKDFNKVYADWTDLIQSGQIRFELETYKLMK